MATPYIGEIKVVPWNFAPKGWAFCNGQILQISTNQALFAVLGTTYGGDGRTTFALPDLKARTPIHFDSTYPLGSKAGESAHTLIPSEMPNHNHFVFGAKAAATTSDPTGALWADSGTGGYLDYAPTPNVAMAPGAINQAGNSQPHNNMQPYLVLNFVIALTGIFPSRN